jgi:hypothetical protein
VAGESGCPDAVQTTGSGKQCRCSIEHYREDAVTDVVRKAVVVLAIAFAVYYLVTQPEQTADVVEATWDLAVDGFNAVIRFFRRLAN